MPIVVAASTDSMFANVTLAAATLVSLSVAAGGAFRAQRVNGPDRAAAFGSPWRLLPVVMMGFAVWVFVQILFGSYVQARLPHPATESRAADLEQELTPAEWAFLATAPPLAGFFTLLVGDYLAGGAAGLRSLGLGKERLRFGVLSGLVGTLVVLPLLAWVLAFTEVIYRQFHYQHPAEHDLLRIIGESVSTPVKAVLIAGAVIVAPLFEELLFRGHAQTLIRSLLLLFEQRLRAAQTEGGGFPVATSTLTRGDDAVLEYARPTAAPIWPTWVAIVIASLAFASVHPRWMWPPIFFLSLCLGYAYERTGILWTSIVIHALFNGVSTWLYLHSR